MSGSAPKPGLPIVAVAARSYDGLDEVTRVRYECGDLAEQTGLPLALVTRLHAMWTHHERPFFNGVADDGMMGTDELAEVVRALKIHSPLICASIARVISGGERVSFATFMRGYGWLHARTLRDALPFACARQQRDRAPPASQSP